MIVNNELRLHYTYCALTGVLLSTLLVLVYVSVWTTTHERIRDDYRLLQKTLTFVKPSRQWDYQNSWRPIGNASKRHVIYSAYFDTRTDIVDHGLGNEDEIPIGSLRIFAILPTYLKDKIRCIIRAEDFTTIEVKTQEARAIHEDYGLPFSAYTIMCPLHIKRESTTVYLPASVAIAYSSNKLSHVSPTFVPISYPRNMEQMLLKSRPLLSICVGPLQLQYGNALRVVEFIEMYRILGASHFYFYHLNASEDVVEVIQYYRREGVADVLEWNLNNHLDDVHYAGIMAEFNECIYRAMIVDNYRYVAVVDLDEMLIPLKHNSLLAFLRQCDEGRTSGYIFRNVFFYRKDSNDSFSVPPRTRNRMLYTQVKVRRTVEVLPAYSRTKAIVNTRSIIEMGNHEIWRAVPGYADSVVHQTVGLLFHYRDKCFNCRAVLVVDYTARRFGSLIWDRVDETCLKLFAQNGGICPLS